MNKLKLSAHELAERSVTVALSPCEVAALVLFHRRHQRRIQRLAGELSIAPSAEYTPAQISAALEECQLQHSGHEARSWQLVEILKASSSAALHHSSTPPLHPTRS